MNSDVILMLNFKGYIELYKIKPGLLPFLYSGDDCINSVNPLTYASSYTITKTICTITR